MTLTGCSAIYGGVNAVNHKANRTKPFDGSFSASSHRLPGKFASSRIRYSLGPHKEQRSFSFQARTPSSYLSHSPSSFSSPKQGGSSQAIYNLPRRSQKPIVPPKASIFDSLFTYKAPPMTKKPRWYWRTLACLPYLMPLHETWMYAKPAYIFLHYLAPFERFTMPFFRFLGRLPRHFFLYYFIGGYLGIVRRKEWPHFIRFNMCLGLLVEISFHLFGACNKWMPKGILWGKLGTYMWSAIVINHFVTVLGCIICALWGTYADIPFFSDAAYIQIPVDR